MTSRSAPPLREPSWKHRLGLTDRAAPALYESANAVTDVPHAPAIRAAFDHLRLTALYCVQGVPTVAILAADGYDREAVIDLHAALWNQGLASLLLVDTETTLRAFSLARKPLLDAGPEFETRCLIAALKSTTDALRFRDFIYGAESGRLWNDHAHFFPREERIDHVLLDNLRITHGLLQHHSLSSDAAQALLIQAMFIAYLEDREIITADYYRDASGNRVDSLSSLLATRDVTLMRALFNALRSDFNGDLFVAPCSFEVSSDTVDLLPDHLSVIARFLSGREEMALGQHRFWGYDFRYIPIELVSAIYDRFLGEREVERRASGAFYTPMFLADTVVSQAWRSLSEEVKSTGRFLDPACGSGVFLVRLFQRLCEHWRTTNRSRWIPWPALLSLLGRIHGWDINCSAVRVAVFSLYVGLLEEVSPPDIRELLRRRDVLPELWNNALLCRDFFAVTPETQTFDLIVGNPPWASRRDQDRLSIAWCTAAGRPMPGAEEAWAFSWKAIDHLTANGLVAFLMPAMGFLHNHAQNSIAARASFFRACHVHRIINFADLRFQLFEQAHRPAALVLYGRLQVAHFPYRFDYWVPKADLALRLRRTITLTTADRVPLSVQAVLHNPRVFKQRLWMREPDAKLFAYFTSLPKLGDLVEEYGNLYRKISDFAGRWVIGQGYQPFGHTDEERGAEPVDSRFVGTLPDLPIVEYTRLAQSTDGLSPASSRLLRRRGFEFGFEGTRVLIPQGVDSIQQRLRASFCSRPATFRDTLQAISVPTGEEHLGKLLTAFLNSRVATWCAFHGTASFGSDRPKVHQEDLLRLPFPTPKDLPDEASAAEAARRLVAIIDASDGRTDAGGHPKTPVDILETIDELVYQYFGLGSDEIALIEDAVEWVIPALQPSEDHVPEIWLPPNETERRLYAETLSESLRPWFQDAGVISPKLIVKGKDLAVLRLRLDRTGPYSEGHTGELSALLEELGRHIHRPVERNFQLMPDLRVFVGDSLYLIKPMQRRYWLRATALCDADGIAADLQQAITSSPSGAL